MDDDDDEIIYYWKQYQQLNFFYSLSFCLNGQTIEKKFAFGGQGYNLVILQSCRTCDNF